MVEGIKQIIASVVILLISFSFLFDSLHQDDKYKIIIPLFKKNIFGNYKIHRKKINLTKYQLTEKTIDFLIKHIRGPLSSISIMIDSSYKSKNMDVRAVQDIYITHQADIETLMNELINVLKGCKGARDEEKILINFEPVDILLDHLNEILNIEYMKAIKERNQKDKAEKESREYIKDLKNNLHYLDQKEKEVLDANYAPFIRTQAINRLNMEQHDITTEYSETDNN